MMPIDPFLYGSSSTPVGLSWAVEPAERFAIIDTLTAIAAGADRHDWSRVRSAFAEQISVDYTSLWGGEIACVPVDDLMAQWRAVLPGFDRTLHLLSNHTIIAFDGTAANVEADFQAMHRIGEDQWVLSGHYRYQLNKTDDRWKVSSLTMVWTHETGDRGLVSRAAERVQLG